MYSQRSIILLLILITLATYWRAASCDFVNCDDFNIYANSYVRQGLTPKDIAWAFTTSTTGYSQPLSWLSLMLDSDLLGTGPRGYHLTNILLHTLAVVLLYLALQAMTAAPWRCALVALLFAVHPLRVESVVWISERKDVLSGCLAFATMLAYAAYAHRPGWLRYLLMTVLFALGLLAKPMLVTLPCLLLLLDFWPLRRLATPPLPAASPLALPCPTRSMGWLMLEKIPLLVLAAADSVVAYVLQVKIGAAPGRQAMPLAIRLPNIPTAYLRYVWKMVWFKGLIVLEVFQAWPWWQIAGATLLLLLITIVVLMRYRLNPWLAVGWFWYLGMLVPVIGLVAISAQSIADRFTYLPTIGLLIMLAWSLPDRLFQTRFGRVAGSAAVLATVIILCAFTWRQIGYWRDGATLFSHVTDFAPHNPAALLGLGLALEHDRGEPQQALDCYRRAVQAAPDFGLAQMHLGILLEQIGHDRNDPGMVEEAMVHLKRAIDIPPPSAEAYNAMGIADLHKKQFDQAMDEFQRATEIDPQFAPAHSNMGIILASQKRFDEALRQYQLALQIDPQDADSYFYAAEMLTTLGRFAQANSYIQTAIQLDPANTAYRAQLVKIQTKAGNSK